MDLNKSAKYLIDTNILIYAFTPQSKRFSVCRNFLEDLVNKNCKTYISTQNILEFKRVLTHPKAEFITPEKTISTAIEILIADHHLIYEDKNVWEIYKILNTKYQPTSNKIYDIWLAATMIANNIDNIITINTKDFQYIKELKTFNPF